MIQFPSIFRRSKNHKIDCKREVEYDSKNLRIKFDGGEYGLELGIYSSALQKVHQALILLDYSQYDLCTKIRNVRDPKERDKYWTQMVRDSMEAKEFHKALAAFYVNPNSEKLESLIFNLLESSHRALEIEQDLSSSNNPASS